MSKKIKIAHVVCVLPPYGGGLGVAAHNQAELMTEAGFDVTVFAPETQEIKSIERKYKIDRLRSILKLGHGAFVPQLFFKLFNFDIIHLHFPFFGAAFIVTLAKLFRGNKTKLVITYHQDLILAGWRNWYYKISMFVLTPLLLRLADKIVVSTIDYVEDSFIKKYYFAHKNKFVEIPFDVSERFFPTKKSVELLNNYGFSLDDFVVLFVGGLDWAHYFKGVDCLIDAIKTIEALNIKALIIGAGNLKTQYQDKVRALALEDRIKFAGYVSNEDLPKYYNLADVVILPSINKNEAFGIVLIEALACGKPIMASNLRGVRCVVENNLNGLLLEPNDPQDIVEKIISLYQNKEKQKLFSANALKCVNEKYRPAVVSEKLKNLYLNLFKIKL
ncbi:MAG: Glycosyltransferase (Modular protein) [Parcubacteria group bacterium GW2011_GWA2_40_23]|nr:MAG: Glycosyltransferase (Modular protein) [Parcubacteria group bacterium GW2011_GWA2_40_23]